MTYRSVPFMRWRRPPKPASIYLHRCEVEVSINGKKMGIVPVRVPASLSDGDTLVVELDIDLELLGGNT